MLDCRYMFPLSIPTRMSDCHPDKKHYARGLCRGCYDNRPERASKMRANRSKWEAKNPDYMAHKWIKLTYGISIDQFNEMLASQDGVCAVCKQTGTEHRPKVCVDHCHDTQKVRGLLCSNCNSGIGYFKDDPQLLRQAAEYLDKSVRRG